MGAAPALHLRGDFLESLREIWNGAENLTAGAALCCAHVLFLPVQLQQGWALGRAGCGMRLFGQQQHGQHKAGFSLP